MTDWAANGTDLTTVPWTALPGEGTVRAAGHAIGTMSTPELAQAACADHNAELARKSAATAASRRGVNLTGGMGLQFGDGGVQNNVFG